MGNDLLNGANFGMLTPEQIADVNKALSVDYSQPPVSGASALRAYSIDDTLKSVTYSNKHIKLWNRVFKQKAHSTVEEYVKLLNYGNMRSGAFVAAGALPASQDSDYSRENKNVKYVGTTRGVQHQATVVDTVVVDDLIAQETINGTEFLIGVIEKSLFDGDASVVAEEWDGLIPELSAENAQNPAFEIVIDKQGAALTKEDLTKASMTILNNYGSPDIAYCDLETMGNVNKLFYQNQMITNVDGNVTGAVATNQFAYLPKQSFTYEPDIFLRPGEKPLTAASSEKAPAAPTASAAASAEASSKLAPATYRYLVVSVNKYGESVASTVASAAVTAGDKVTLTITHPANDTATGFKIYRGTVAGEETLIARIPKTKNSSTTVYTDLNQNVDHTGQLILMTDNPNNYAFRQLIPFIKIPLAVVDASIRWMQMLYGVPMLFTPRKNVLVKNIAL